MTEKNIKFLNFGSLNTDMVYTVDHTVRPGETTASSKLEYFCGGKGLNQSIALSRAGARIFHAGCVGSDGDRLIEQLEINGIDVHLVKKADMPSGHAIIQVDKNGQNSILLFGGAIVRVNFLQQSEAFGWNPHRVVFPRFHNFLVGDFFSDAEFSEFAAERGHVYPPFFEQRKDTALTIGAQEGTNVKT